MISANKVLCSVAGALLIALAAPSGGQTAPDGSFISRYQARVTATQNEQPHWVTPLVLVTPRLEQEIRTDFVRQTNSKLQDTWNYGNSKGLEIIPLRRVELLFNLPPFFDHQTGAKDGFGDMSFNSKLRILSANEQHGSYIMTAYLAATIPTGKDANGSCCAVVTPSIGGGKGWGTFDVETTFGGSLPVTNAHGLGHTMTWNSVLQDRLAKTGPARLFWPELEFNSSFYSGGANDGKIATYATPGLVIGRIPLAHNPDGTPGRLGLTFGAGEQTALTHFHTYNHGIVITARIPF